MPFPSLADFDAQALLRMADEHDDLAFGAMLENQPEMIVQDGFYQFLTGRMNPYANMLFGLNVPDAERKVSDITAWLSDKKAPAFWWVGPLTEPSSLHTFLLASGWKEGKPAPAMIIDLGALTTDQVPIGLEIKPVQTESDLSVWHKTFAKGFELPMEVGQLITPPKRASITLYTAFLDGEPVGTTALFIHASVPGIYCVSTVPEFRGKGIGAAITALPLIEARKQGYRTGTLQASQMGYPVYKRLGFQDVCHLRVFTFNM